MPRKCYDTGEELFGTDSVLIWQRKIGTNLRKLLTGLQDILFNPVDPVKEKIRMKRKYPRYPIPAVSGVVLNNKNEVLAIRRGTNPGKGQWSLPGGAVHLGEPIRDAVRREIREECGIEVSVIEILGIFDRIFRNKQGRVEYHYVLVSFLCRLEEGQLSAQSDAQAVRWIGRNQLDDFEWTTGVKEFLESLFQVVSTSKVETT